MNEQHVALGLADVASHLAPKLDAAIDHARKEQEKN